VAKHLSKAQAGLNELKDKEKNLASFSTSELVHIASINPVEKLPGLVLRKLAGAKISTSITEKQLEVQLSAEAVEALGFLMWRHLEHYLLYSSTASAATPDTPYQATLRRLNESKDKGLEYGYSSPRSKFPSFDLEKLKSDVRITLNDTFFEKLGDIVDLVETRTSTGTSSAGFLQAIIRRTKRLAQLYT